MKFLTISELKSIFEDVYKHDVELKFGTSVAKFAYDDPITQSRWEGFFEGYRQCWGSMMENMGT